MPRDGTKNLRPMNKRSKDEAKKLGAKGGKASGVARRKKADLKRALNTVLTSQVHQPQLAKLLEDMGYENSYEMAIVFSMTNKATQGDARAAEWISNVMGIVQKDSLDKQEQRERIKSLKLDNKERESVSLIEDEKIIVADSWEAEDENS